MPEVTIVDENFSTVKFSSDDDLFSATSRSELLNFDRENGDDVITNFDPNEDIINLTRVDLQPDELQSEQTDGGLLLSWDGGSVLLEGFAGEPDPSWLLTAEDRPEGGDVDIIFGGEGNDTIIGAEGSTTIVVGGGGNDTFITAGEDNAIVALDFDAEEDSLLIDNPDVLETDLDFTSTDSGLEISTGLEGRIELVGITSLPSDFIAFGDGSTINAFQQQYGDFGLF